MHYFVYISRIENTGQQHIQNICYSCWHLRDFLKAFIEGILDSFFITPDFFFNQLEK